MTDNPIEVSISTDELYELYERTKSLFPKTTIDDFIDEVDEGGYWDMLARINIQEEFSNHLLKYLGGKSNLRNKYQLFLNGELEDPIRKRVSK